MCDVFLVHLRLCCVIHVSFVFVLWATMSKPFLWCLRSLMLPQSQCTHKMIKAEGPIWGDNPCHHSLIVVSWLSKCRLDSCHKRSTRSLSYIDRSAGWIRSFGILLICGLICCLYDSYQLLLAQLFSYIMSSSIRTCCRARPAISQMRSLRPGFITRRKYASPPNPRGSGPKGVWAPRTRIAIGIVFIGAMIYSMVYLTPQWMCSISTNSC